MNTMADVIPCRSSGFEKTDQRMTMTAMLPSASIARPCSSRADSASPRRPAAILQPSRRRLPFEATRVGTQKLVAERVRPAGLVATTPCAGCATETTTEKEDAP